MLQSTDWSTLNILEKITFKYIHLLYFCYILYLKKSKIIKMIFSTDMAPFYEEVCKDLEWQVDEAFLATMKAHNEEQLKKLDDAIEDAEKNLGEMEVRDANLKKSEYLCRIGDKEGAISAFRKTYDKTVSLGHRLDIVFHNIRIGLFYLDHDHITKNIEKAKR